MSIKSTKMMVILAATALTVGSSAVFAQDHRYDDRPDNYNRQYDGPYDDPYDNRYDDEGGYDYASEVMTRNLMEADAEEGISAFIDKRAPKWKA